MKKLITLSAVSLAAFLAMGVATGERPRPRRRGQEGERKLFGRGRG